MTTPSLRVLLVDDHPLFRQTMRDLLKDYPSLEVVGEASNGVEAVACVGKLKPDVVLMDIHLHDPMDGIVATCVINNHYPGVAIVGLSLDTREYVVTAMRSAGSFHVLTKEQTSAAHIYATIQKATASKTKHAAMRSKH